nr:hypothetical protein [Tanacetum cinerariifolium]
MTEEELDHHFDERLENLKRKRSGTWQPWPTDDNKLNLECYKEEKKEDNHMSKMEIGISIDGGIIDFKNLKFKDWLDVRYGNDQPKDLLGRARLFKEWVAKSCDELFEEYSSSIIRIQRICLELTPVPQPATIRFERRVDVRYIYKHTRRYFAATLYYVACWETQFAMRDFEIPRHGKLNLMLLDQPLQLMAIW